MILASVPGHPSLHLQTPRNTIFLAQKKDQEVDPADVEHMGKKNPGSPGFCPLFFKLFLQISESHLNYHHRVCQIPGAKFPSKLVEFCSSCRGFNDGHDGTVMGCHQEVTTTGRWWCGEFLRQTCHQKKGLVFWEKKGDIFLFAFENINHLRTRSQPSSFEKMDVCVKSTISWCWTVWFMIQLIANHLPCVDVSGTRLMIDFGKPWGNSCCKNWVMKSW